MAAGIGVMFSIDPITVLNCDYFTWSVRLAAYNVAVEEKNKANEQARRKAKQK